MRPATTVLRCGGRGGGGGGGGARERLAWLLQDGLEWWRTGHVEWGRLTMLCLLRLRVRLLRVPLLLHPPIHPPTHSPAHQAHPCSA